MELELAEAEVSLAVLVEENAAARVNFNPPIEIAEDRGEFLGPHEPLQRGHGQ